MIDHVAIVTKQLEKMKDFYSVYFGGEVKKWISPDETGVIYFIRYENGTVLEIEQRMEGKEKEWMPKGSRIGIEHIAFRVDSRDEVRRLTKQIEEDGHRVVQWPTDYGCEGFYESCILDPDGNFVEITIDAGIFQ